MHSEIFVVLCARGSKLSGVEGQGFVLQNGNYYQMSAASSNIVVYQKFYQIVLLFFKK